MKRLANKVQPEPDFWAPQIVIPADWNAREDRRYVRDLLEPRGDYWTAAIERLEETYVEIDEALDEAICFFSVGADEVILASPFSKLGYLRRLVRARTANAEARARRTRLRSLRNRPRPLPASRSHGQRWA